MNDLEVFARLGGPPFLRWLEAEKAESVKYLTEAIDVMQIHRAQGKVQLINRMLNLLEKAKNT